LGFVFEANVVRVVVGVELGEGARDVEFARVGFVTVGAAGDLHVREAAAQFVRALDRAAFGVEDVVEVELQRDVRLRDAIENRNRLRGRLQNVGRIL
jgi:hypothetical protein